VLAPAVGVLGTFITGSATASNILFTDFQLSAAERLGLAPLPMTAAQGVGSAVGNIVAPHNIIAGSATVGLVGREGDILRKTALPCILYVLAAGLLTLPPSDAFRVARRAAAPYIAGHIRHSGKGGRT
jgi:lactate permease